MYELTDEPTDRLHFVIMSDSIGNGLEEQIAEFKSQHCGLKIVFIDTLQMIRNEADSNYGSDYRELSVLKSLAGKLEIAIVVVHHTRKCSDSDPINMISGSTGLSGCVDGSMVLIESKRGSRTAKLYCVGRDIENQEIDLVFENSRWKAVDETKVKEPDVFSFAVHDFMLEQKDFKGSATELANELSIILCKEIFSNCIKKELMYHAYELQSYGVTFESKRSNGQRIIILKYDLKSDSSAAKKLRLYIFSRKQLRRSNKSTMRTTVPRKQNLLRKPSCLPILTPELIKVFIKRIEVFEKEEKYSRTCGNRIVIYFTFQSDNGIEIDKS